MRKVKIGWIFVMAILLSTLILIVNSRVRLTSEIVIGGNDSVFVETNHLKGPLDDYTPFKELDEKEIMEEKNEEKYSGLTFPNIRIDNWRYVLINSGHPKNGFVPEVYGYGSDGNTFDVDALSALRKLVKAAKEEGFDPYLGTGYISYSDQKQLYNDKAEELAEDGSCTFSEALILAEQYVMKPGTSDHQTGLGIDIFDREYETADYSEMNTEFYDWLNANCGKYGFIQRYPEGKAEITGWTEPWHYRFVGITAAEFIMENGLCLEEFVQHY